LLNPPEENRQYSSVWDNGTDHAQSMLDNDSGFGWSPLAQQVGEWMVIDLGTLTNVTGVVTQGRNNSQHNQWVTSYTVDYSLDDGTW